MSEPTPEMIEAGATFAKNYETYNDDGWHTYVTKLYEAMQAVAPKYIWEKVYDGSDGTYYYIVTPGEVEHATDDD